jgi:hypothetical protein
LDWISCNLLSGAYALYGLAALGISQQHSDAVGWLEI